LFPGLFQQQEGIMKKTILEIMRETKKKSIYSPRMGIGKEGEPKRD